MSGLRVALVSEHASPLATLGGVDAGGQNVHVAELARGLARLGCEVVVHTRRDDTGLPPRVPLDAGVWVEHVDAGPPEALPKDDLYPFMADFARQLEVRWRAERPDVAHAHFWMSGLAAWRAARALGLPVLQTFHALGAVKRRHQGDADTSPPERDVVERLLVRETDGVLATCRDEVQELAALGARLERVQIVPCGVDPARFCPEGDVAPRSGLPRLVVVTRLVARKGVEDVIRALPLLPGVELVVAGGPAPAQLGGDAEASRLQAIADELGVSDRCHLLGGVSRDDVPSLLRSADAVVCAPWYEPFGIVPLEAMACGVPVVGAAVGGLLDSVVDGVTGYHVAPHSPTAIADAVGRLLGDPEGRARMGEAAARWVRERFTWPQVARATLTAYRGVLAAGATRAVSA